MATKLDPQFEVDCEFRYAFPHAVIVPGTVAPGNVAGVDWNLTAENKG